MLTIILIAVAVVIAAILIYAATKPDSFAYQRSTTINAPAEKIFPLINDLKAMTTWSPFEKDPTMKRTFSGPESGPGQLYVFADKQSAGDVSILANVPNEGVSMRLKMTKPFACDNAVNFTLVPNGAGTSVSTQVTWAMSGKQPYMGKLMSVFIDCEKMCQKQFDEGLAKLKSMTEH
jgi:uncharacterized protein YndB with AHSA1/START domain